MNNIVELRKLAHLCLAADMESGQSPDTWHESDMLEEADGFCPEDAAFIAAASPAVVIALLDRLEKADKCANCGQVLGGGRPVLVGGEMTDGEAACSRFCVDELAERGCPHEHHGGYRSAKWYADLCRQAEAQRDEARAAVKRLAGALEEIAFQTTQHGGAAASLRLIRSSLADPVVRRIVEE
jgi:hypothetical protein